MNFEEFIDITHRDIIESVQNMIKIRSVKQSPKPDAPFGEGINDALRYALSLAELMGFKTRNIDGYIGYAEYGDGEEVIGVLGHLDVVPEGSGWLFPPYEARIHDNKIYGRGAIDNKGPIIAALYGLKAIKESGVSLNKRVRIIFGTDEEGDWNDIEMYKDSETPPDIGFTPDGMFPVINVEKGSIDLEFKKSIVRKSRGMISIKSIEGGDAVNIVPNYSKCHMKLKDMAKLMFKDTLELYCEKNNVNMIIEEGSDYDTIFSRGLSCHSSLPQRGKNAIAQLIVFLSQFNLGQNDVADFIKHLSRFIGTENDGKNLNINYSDEISGELTLNLGRIRIDDESASAVFNIRYPVSAKFEDIIENIKKVAYDKKIEVAILKHRRPLCIDEDSKLISTLKNVYNEITKGEDNAIAIGGQTYAKAFKNMAAFGPIFPEEDNCAHMPNEYINIDNLIKCTKIYAKAIYELSS